MTDPLPRARSAPGPGSGEVIRRHIKPGRRADETLAVLNAEVEKAGFAIMKEFNKPRRVPFEDDAIATSRGSSGSTW